MSKEASRACAAEFPESRVCEYSELMTSIPPPPAFPAPDAAIVAFWVNGPEEIPLDLRCIRGDGQALISGCASVGILTAPAACCG